MNDKEKFAEELLKEINKQGWHCDDYGSELIYKEDLEKIIKDIKQK